ncbi:hypothetical protein AM593_08727, partial [Mytilus galloprovincialis]
MMMMRIIHIVSLLFLIEDVICLPCLNNEAKEDFDKSRKDLTLVQSDIGKVVSTLESNHQQTITRLETALKKTVSAMENNVKKTTDVLKNNLGTFKTTLNSMGQKIKKLDTDFIVLGKDFRKTKWIKYGGHCYFYSSDVGDWFTAEV